MSIAKTMDTVPVKKEFYEWLLGRLIDKNEMKALDQFFNRHFSDKPQNLLAIMAETQPRPI